MKTIIDQKDCTGCGACFNVCPHGCISMATDVEGFKYPLINEKKCVNCSLCLKTCPVLNCEFVSDHSIPPAYLTCANNNNVRIKGASGGLFITIARKFLKDNHDGVVVGVAYDENFYVKHIIVDNIMEVDRLAKSKYVQSDIGRIFDEIKGTLNCGKHVLFSGTPCQIYGLRAFLKKDYNNLFCIDVVCHGVPSPLVFKRYLDWHYNNNGEIVQVIFRDKKLFFGGYDAGMGISFKNGKRYFKSNISDYYCYLFFGELSPRESCHACKFKILNHISDLTLGDCWFTDEFIGKNDTCGYTLAFVQSQKGESLLEIVEELIDKHKIDSETAVKANGGLLYRSTAPHPRRTEFFEDIADEKKDFGEIVEKYFPPQKPKPLKQIVRKLPHIYLLWKKYSLKKDFNNRMKREIPDSARGIVIIRST